MRILCLLHTDVLSCFPTLWTTDHRILSQEPGTLFTSLILSFITASLPHLVSNILKIVR